MTVEKEFLGNLLDLQDKVVNAAGLVGILAEAADTSETAAGNMGCALDVLYGYLRRIEDGFEQAVEDVRQKKEV